MLHRLLLICDRVIGAAACLILVLLLACVTLGVVTRSLGDPLVWTDEISRFLMVWLAVFGWILASRRRTHVKIRFFQNLLPRPAWKAAEIGFQLAMFIFGAGVMFYSVGLVFRNLDLEATTVPISFAWLYAPMVLAGAVTAAQAVGEIFEIRTQNGDQSQLSEGVVE